MRGYFTPLRPSPKLATPPRRSVGIDDEYFTENNLNYASSGLDTIRRSVVRLQTELRCTREETARAKNETAVERIRATRLALISSISVELGTIRGGPGKMSIVASRRVREVVECDEARVLLGRSVEVAFNQLFRSNRVSASGDSWQAVVSVISTACKVRAVTNLSGQNLPPLPGSAVCARAILAVGVEGPDGVFYGVLLMIRSTASSPFETVDEALAAHTAAILSTALTLTERADTDAAARFAESGAAAMVARRRARRCIRALRRWRAWLSQRKQRQAAH